MATLTIRNIPPEVLDRLKHAAARNRRSMEEEVRQLLQQRYADRLDVLRAIEASQADFTRVRTADIRRRILRGRR